MKLRSRNCYATPDERARLARFLSTTICGHENRDIPYMPNMHDTEFWTLDNGNDWKVRFNPEEVNTFEIIYRYQCDENPYEEALAEWLIIRMGVCIVPRNPKPHALGITKLKETE